jgi:dihydropteroate synthase
MIDGFKIGMAAASLEASYEFYFGKRRKIMPWHTTINWGNIPERMRRGIINYVESGVPPGSFLEAIFCNNLTEAFGKADSENIELIREYAKFLHNECPSICWGSRKRFLEWIGHRGLYGQKLS